jgi:hypothetical protein
MASDDEANEPQACMPCRGTGQVTSHLGGTPKLITCPWCDGGGVRLTAIDAQAAWPENPPPEPPPPPPEPDAAA